MKKSIFEQSLKRKISQITFSGYRVNDDYTINKRKAIMAAVLSAFDEAAEHSAQADGDCWTCVCGELHMEGGSYCDVCGTDRPRR